MEYEVEKPRENLKDGMYTGVTDKQIVRKEMVGKSGKKYQMAMVYVKVDGFDVVLRVGYPAFVKPTSDYGQLLARFGAELTTGVKVNDDILLDKPCQFLVVQEKTDKGVFSNIVRSSLKLRDAQ